MDDDAPPGVPEWVVTYGDMMSLLLTFFIMLVSLSEVKAESKFRAILEAARQYMGYSGAPLSPPGKSFPLNSIADSLRDMKLGSVSDDQKGTGGVKQQAPKGQNMKMQRLREGESQLAGPAITFSPGSTQLEPAQQQRVDHIAQEIAGKPHKLELRAFSSEFVNGVAQTPEARMQLSYQRADLVMQRLISDRVLRKRMRIAVYFQNPPNEDNSQAARSEDRVEVVILDEYADTYIGREADYR